jgi:hypothetical protein
MHPARILKYNNMNNENMARALDRGRIGIFYASKMPKTHWR